MSRFVVHEHHATRLHWDFRLELDGVLASWAVPKGPPLEYGIKRLAIQVGDHPLDYIDFQGMIEESEYGAGKVTIWDSGEYDLKNREADALGLELKGNRMKGDYKLFRMKGNDWLLYKVKPRISTASVQVDKLGINSEPMLAFYNHVINEYKPPQKKRFLVFLQCSVRRPFSSSPSHATLRRAIWASTGYDPRKDFESCPVHAVVLEDSIGPVPYELEDIHPVNVRGNKLMDDAYFAHAKPILAQRMANYIAAHGECYEHVSTFTAGRYGAIMREAREIADVDFNILPTSVGARIVRRGPSIPRKYWEVYWIQLYLEIVSWLKPDQQREATIRLKEMGVEYKGTH